MTDTQYASYENLDEAILSVAEFAQLQKTMPPRKTYLFPFIKESTYGMVYAPKGTCKTFFTLGVLDAVTAEKSFGPWRCIDSVPSLYLDGEMTGYDDLERIKILNLDSTPRKNPFYFYCDSFAIQQNIPRANLTDPLWQFKIKNYLLDHGIKLWVVDNIASLASGLDENSRQDWDPVNQFFLDLRFNGITSIIVHHSGKSKKSGQRGTSAREDNLDWVLTLQRPDGYQLKDGIKFVTKFQKSRVNQTDLDLLEDVEFRLETDQSGKSIWHNRPAKKDSYPIAIKLISSGLKYQEIADEIGSNKSYVSQLKARAVKDGYLNTKLQLTSSGQKYVGNY